MALDDDDMTTTAGGGNEGPADSGAGGGTPGVPTAARTAVPTGGAEGPADSGAGSGTPGVQDGGADGGADCGAPRVRRTPAPAAARRVSRTAAPTAVPMVGQTGARTAVPADLTRPVSSAGRSASDRPAPVARRRCSRLTGLDAAAFGDRHWGRGPLLARGADPDGFRDLLDLDGVDELLSRRGLRTPFIRLARNGAVVDSASFTGRAGWAPRSPTRSATTGWRPCSPTGTPSSCRRCTAPGRP